MQNSQLSNTGYLRLCSFRHRSTIIIILNAYADPRQALRDIEEHSKTPQDVIDEIDAEEAAEKAAVQNISEIQIFNSNLHPEFGNLRTLTIDGEPWFVGKDVAEALGYSNSSKAIITHVADEDKIIKMLPNSQNGKTIGKTYIINESGLYSLILSSKLESAKVFKHWVTSEVLPTIRKTGGYINQGQEDLFVEIHLVPTSHLKYS